MQTSLLPTLCLMPAARRSLAAAARQRPASACNASPQLQPQAETFTPATLLGTVLPEALFSGDAPEAPFPPISADGKVALLGLRYDELQRWLLSVGEKPTRAKARAAPSSLALLPRAAPPAPQALPHTLPQALFGALHKDGAWALSAADLPPSDVAAPLRARLAGCASFDGDLSLAEARSAAPGPKPQTLKTLNTGKEP